MLGYVRGSDRRDVFPLLGRLDSQVPVLARHGSSLFVVLVGARVGRGAVVLVEKLDVQDVGFGAKKILLRPRAVAWVAWIPLYYAFLICSSILMLNLLIAWMSFK